MTTPNRIPPHEYENNNTFAGNGLSKFCMKCMSHRPYTPGGLYVGPKGMKYWICKLHAPKDPK